MGPLKAVSPNGVALAALGVLCLVAGVLLRNPSLVGVGVAFLAVVALAVVTTARHPDLAVVRHSRPDRLVVGEAAEIEVTVTNVGRRRTRRRSAHDSWGGTSIPLPLPALAPGESFRHADRFVPERRGVVPVGPLRLSRADPFGVIQGGGQAGGVARLVVLPRTRPLHTLPAGRRRDLDGPTSSVAPEGGIAFHTLREYDPGDDLRLVHWRSTARTGRLMVRRNVDTNQPDIVLVLDTGLVRWEGSSAAFEVAVSVMASLVEATRLASSAALLATTGPGEPLVQGDADHDWSLPDLLAAVEPEPGATVVDTVAALAPRDPGQSLVVVTGALDDGELPALRIAADRFSRAVVVAVGGRGRTTDDDRMTVAHVDTLDDFARFWNGDVS